MRFLNQNKEASLVIALLNPFGQTSGSIILSKKLPSEATTLNGSKEILQHPLFTQMRDVDWAEELRFMFGLPLKAKDSHLFWSPSTGQQKLLSQDGREWICRFKDSKPHECSVTSNWGRAEINFTSVQCLE
jgi:hypothetical protein